MAYDFVKENMSRMAYWQYTRFRQRIFFKGNWWRFIYGWICVISCQERLLWVTCFGKCSYCLLNCLPTEYERCVHDFFFLSNICAVSSHVYWDCYYSECPPGYQLKIISISIIMAGVAVTILFSMLVIMNIVGNSLVCAIIRKHRYMRYLNLLLTRPFLKFHFISV